MQFSDSDKEKIVDYAGKDVLTVRKDGKGRVIFCGFETYLSNANYYKILENTIRWSGELSHRRLVHAASPALYILQGNTASTTLMFNAGNLNAGSYDDTLFIVTNDPAHEIVAVPVHYTVTGAASLRLSAPCLNFGSASTLINNDSVVVYNDGCDTLFVNSLTHADSAYEVSTSFNFLVAGDSGVINVSYDPQFPGVRHDTIYYSTSAGDTSICLLGQPGMPLSEYHPDSFYVTLGLCRDTVSLPLACQNSGGSDLQLNLLNPASLGQRPEILALTKGTDPGTEYPNTLAAIRTFAPQFLLTEIQTTDTAALRSGLIGKDVLLFPEPETAIPADYTAMDTILQEFISGGGTVIFCGAYGNQSACMFNTGLFHGTFAANAGGSPLTVSQPADPLATGVSPVFTAPTGTYAVTLSDTDIVRVVSFGAFDVAAYRNSGAGKVVFLAFDYFSYDANAARLIANAVSVIGGAGHHDWLNISPSSLNIPSSGSGAFNLTFTTTSLNYGTHADTLFITSNNPFHPVDTVVCVLEVNQHFCADFGHRYDCHGQVSFLDSSSNNPTSWLWDFGDGGVSTLRNPIHQYLQPGNYTVRLIASNATDNDTIQYTVTPHFVQDVLISASGSFLPGGQIVFSSNDSTGVSRVWSFGDGTHSTLSNTLHAYSLPGVYTAILTVTDAAGCIYSDSVQVVIINVSVSDITTEQAAFVSPNPCKSETILTYMLDKTGDTEIIVYDILGKKLETVPKIIQQSPGKYSRKLNFDAPGFYFISLRRGNQVMALKVISE
jgi:hypothetical protein